MTASEEAARVAMNTLNSALPAQRAARLWPLAALLVVGLFPIGWLGEVYAPLGGLLEGTFGSVEAHAVAHALIFLLIGAALLAAFPALRSRPLLYFGLLLAAALCQEGIQLLYKQRPLVYDDFRDIGVDTIGMAAAFLLARLWNRPERPAPPASEHRRPFS
jgi:hypothetical protein